MSSNKATSAGTKVESGNRPEYQEGAGKVASESLAAESLNEGGEFSKNQGINTENQATSNTQSTGGSTGVPESQAGTAPTYVNNLYHRDPNRPHGKNLKEGGWDESKAEDGIQKAMNAEIGSIDNPSRVAEHKMQLNQAAGGRETGPKQGHLTNKTAYDALGSDVSS